MTVSWTLSNGTQGCSFGDYFQPTNWATKTTLALNSGYTYNTSGAAALFGFMCADTGNLTDFYLKVDSLTTYPGTTDGLLNVEIRVGTSGTRQPGSSLVSGGAFTAAVSATGWVHASGLSIALTAGQIYSVVIGDADGNASNFATIVLSYGSAQAAPSIFTGFQIGSSANGFNTTGTLASSVMPCLVMKINGTLYSGHLFDTVATVTNNTNERGMRFSPLANCVLAGCTMAVSLQNLIQGNKATLYADATAPGGTPITQVTFPANSSVGAGMGPTFAIFDKSKWTLLTAGTYYRFVCTPSSALVVPRKSTINGSPDANVLASALPFGNGHWTESSSGTWDDSQTASISELGPILLPADAVSGGQVSYGFAC